MKYAIILTLFTLFSCSKQVEKETFFVDSFVNSRSLTLQHTNPFVGDELGTSVFVSDSIILGGAPGRKVGIFSKAGSVFIITNGIQTNQLSASDKAAVDYFGNSLAMSGNTVVVGAHGKKVGTSSASGAVYLFDRTTWTQTAKLIPSDTIAYQYFGRSVDVEGSYVLVGAPTQNSKGAVYLFNGTTQVLKLTSPANQSNEFFGSSVKLENGKIYVGANGNQNNRGCVYVFDYSGNLLQTITAFDRAVGDGFGTSLDVKMDTLLVGAPNNNTYAGSVYRFENGVFTSIVNGTNRFGTSISYDDNIFVGNFNEVVNTKGSLFVIGKRLEDSRKGIIEII